MKKIELIRHGICAILAILLIIFSVLTGCSKGEPEDPVIVISPDGNADIDVDNIVINIPQATGQIVYDSGGTVIDASNTGDGYVMVKHSGSSKLLKVKISKADSSYAYDLNNLGEYEVYPLQMGNGTYTVKVYENVEGTSYIALYSVNIKVQMSDIDRVFVFPNQYVWYTNADKAIKKSYELCSKANTDEEKADIIYKYISTKIKYDNNKAATVKSGYLPDVDETLASRKGICFDYSALMAAMLRAQNIPTRLVIGNVEPENILHAWNQVYIGGKWIWMDATFGKYNKHKESNYTEDRKY